MFDADHGIIVKDTLNILISENELVKNKKNGVLIIDNGAAKYLKFVKKMSDINLKEGMESLKRKGEDQGCLL